MKLTRLVRWQLIVFALLAVVSVVYGSIHYVGIGRITGLGTYQVTAEFADGGGIYESGLVTYRGVTVGRVTHVGLDIDDVTAPVKVTLRLNSDYRIPRDSSAFIKSASAVGEQFIDLIPRQGAGQNLVDGDVLPEAGNHSPTPTKDVLEKTQRLVAAISPDNLDTTLTEVSDGLDKTGDDLGRLIDASRDLLRLAQVDLGPTTTLIEDAEPLLRTGNRVAPNLRSSFTSLASFTDQLAKSDQQIRTVLDASPPAADEVSDTLRDLTPTLPVLLANLQTVGQVMRVNIPQLRQILTVYPALSVSTGYSAKDFALGDSPQAPLDVKLGNTLNPPICTEGYGRTTRRDPSDMGPLPVVPDQYCDINADNPKVARGARNIPCATDPTVRTAFVAECPRGLPSTWQGMLARPYAGAAPQPSGTPTTGARSQPRGGEVTQPSDRSPETQRLVPYSESTGQFRGPDGITYIVGTPTETSAGEEKLTWQSLLIRK
ncbi:MCE family protein [Gordonia sputi]